jgi:hypothetical protein
MKNTSKWVIGILVAVVAFAANPNGPLGGFWRPDSMSPDPTSLQLPFFILLNIFESLTFALAVVLLIFNLPKKPLAPLSLNQTRGAFISLLWFMGNWWAHDSLHMHIGMNLQSLLFLEYGFHVTLMLASLYLLWIARKLWVHKK